MARLMISRSLSLTLLLVLVAPSAWAEPEGLSLYERGEYEAAAQAFETALAMPDLPTAERGRMRLYLAASWHALGRVEQAQAQLELLARDHPEQRLDSARFLPELVAWAEAIRQRVEAEQRFAHRPSEPAPVAPQEVPLSPPDKLPVSPPSPATQEVRLRPELFTLVSAMGRRGLPGAGLTYVHGGLEGSARLWLTHASPLVHLQGGLLLGRGRFQPQLGLRAVLAPGQGGYGSGAVVGGRLSLPARFVALVELGADYFLIGDALHHRFEVTAQAGLGFELPLP